MRFNRGRRQNSRAGWYKRSNNRDIRVRVKLNIKHPTPRSWHRLRICMRGNKQRKWSRSGVLSSREVPLIEVSSLTDDRALETVSQNFQPL